MLIRRRMMGDSQPTPLYELQSSVSTTDYDTGVKLFDPATDFTIVLEAYYTNRNWYNTMSLFGISTGAYFRMGYCSGFYNVANGEAPASTSNSLYTALVMNNDGDTTTKKAGSMQARYSNTTKVVHRYAIRFNSSTRMVEGFTYGSYRPGTTTRYWTIDSNISNSNTIKLNLGTGTSSEIRIFRVYDTLLTDSYLNAFLDGVID